MSLRSAFEMAEPYLAQYGYVAIFVAVFVEGFAIPAPGQSLTIAGALLADRGELRIVPLAVAVWGAAVLGDNVGYALGRFGGRELVLRANRRSVRSAARLAAVEGIFRRHGAPIVVVARFVDVFRQLNGIVAGLAGMRWSRFAIFDGIGSGLWVGVWCLGVYYLGEHVDRIHLLLESPERYIVGAGVLVLLLLLLGFLSGRSGR